jgi:hypothetical protein
LAILDSSRSIRTIKLPGITATVGPRLLVAMCQNTATKTCQLMSTIAAPAERYTWPLTAIGSFFAAWPSLARFELEYFEGGPDALPANSVSHLEQFDLRYGRISTAQLRDLLASSQVSLTNVYLCDIRGLHAGQLFDFLKGATNLKHLALSRCDFEDVEPSGHPQGQFYVDSVFDVAGCTSLQYLSVHTASASASLLRGLPKATAGVQLRVSNWLDPQAVVAAIDGLPRDSQLKELGILSYAGDWSAQGCADLKRACGARQISLELYEVEERDGPLKDLLTPKHTTTTA